MNNRSGSYRWRAVVTAPALAAAVSFLVGLLVFEWASLRVLGPFIVAVLSPASIEAALGWVAVSVYSATLLAGLVGGTAGAAVASRRGSGRVAAALQSLLSVVVVLGACVLIASSQHFPAPVRSVLINLACGCVGAVGGSVGFYIRAARRQRPRSLGRSLPPPLLVLALVLGAGIPVDASALGPTPGPTAAAKPGPGCVTDAISASAGVSAVVNYLAFGGEFKYQEEGSADGSWESKVTTGLQGGFRFTLAQGIGAKLVPLPELAGGADIELSSHAAVAVTTVYKLRSKQDADRAVAWATLPFLDDAVAVPTVSQFFKPTLTPESVFKDFVLKPPVESDLALTGDVTVGASAGPAHLLGYHVDLALTSGVGVRLMDTQNKQILAVVDPKQVEVFMKLGESLDSKAVVLMSSVSGPSGNLEQVLSLKADRMTNGTWNPTSLNIEGTAEVVGQNRLAPIGDLNQRMRTDISAPMLPSLLGSISALSARGGHGVSVEIADSIDYAKHPEDIPETSAVMIALKPFLTDQQPNAGDRQHLRDAALGLAQAFVRDGDLEGKLYRIERGDFGIDIGFGQALPSVSGSIGGSTEHLITAIARGDQGQIGELVACRVTPHP